jgi:hypothetical protein
MSFQVQGGHSLYIKPCGVLGSAIGLIYQSFIFDIHTPHPFSPLKGIIQNNYLTPQRDGLF